MKRHQVGGWLAGLALVLGTSGLNAQPPGAGPEKKYRDYAEVVRGATKHEGFFTLQKKDDHVYAEIMPFQFDQPMLVPITIARGLAMAGQPLNFGDEWVISFHKVGDRVQVIRRNVHYKASGNSAVEKAVKQNYNDSILMAVPIATLNPMNQAVLIDLSDIFLGDFGELGFGYLDRNRTTWLKVTTFPNNVELEVEATFGGGFGMSGDDDGVVDHRGRTVVIHYSLAKLPEPGYHPRVADHRVGHFLNATKDFSSSNPDTNFLRYVNRWRLEKADPRAKLSAPKKQIIWYVEDTVPHEYRPAVEEGIREWNKAFEKIGFRDAISVRWQETGRDDFDPEDINYCTFRWITTNQTYAMSCLRSNPLTGEMIDGDVIFDASWIRHWKREYALLTGAVQGQGNGKDVDRPIETFAVGEIISPIMAAKRGFGLPTRLPDAPGGSEAERSRFGSKVGLVPSHWNGLQVRLRERQSAGGASACQYTTGIRSELSLAAIAMAGEKKDGDGKLPEEFLNQLIKEVVMHEVGHSLGLRHNFKASTMLTADQINDTNITHAKGMVGSVMDYNPVNLAPKGQKQGDYCTTTIGPYDYWAIEYAYKPVDGDEDAELKKIAARSPEPDLVFATDEDMYMSNDPLVNTYDLGSDTLRFAKDRIALATDLLKDLDAKVVKDGDSYAKAREAFSTLLNQWGNGAYLVASYVGGQSVSRDHRGKGSRDPVSPVSAVKQREALAFLTDQILSDKAFKFSPTLLRRLATETWTHWGSQTRFGSGTTDYPVNESILSIQKIALSLCLAPDVLNRLENQELQVDAGADTLRLAEVFKSLSDGIWSELNGTPAGADPKKAGLTVSTIRRNLQREYLSKLCTMVVGSRSRGFGDDYGYVMFYGAASYPPDAKSLARHHLKDLNTKIAKALDQKDTTVDDTTRAHLEECRHRIAKALDAAVQANEP